MNIAALSIISISFLTLVGADGTNKECPKYLSLAEFGKYRLVVKGTESGFETCHGDIANCVFTREMMFYCMSGTNIKNYKPTEVQASYENLKENVTTTSFGKAGGEKFEIDLTGTNTAIRMRLYQMDFEVRFVTAHALYKIKEMIMIIHTFCREELNVLASKLKSVGTNTSSEIGRRDKPTPTQGFST